MRLSRKIMVAASAIAIGGSVGLTAGPVGAVTAHCDANEFPNKVELDGTSASFDTNLPAGTEVCIKAGNEVVIVVVGPGGVIQNLEITNAQGKFLGISYYAYGETYEPPPCEPYDPYCS